MNTYKAPWCLTLHIVSWAATAICLVVSFAGADTLRQHGMGHLAFWLAVLPLALIPGCALFTVRGYVVTPESILVRRLLWNTVLPRADLVSAAVEPDAFKWSLRTFGNGGFFSFTGFYWNRRLRSFRAFITDPRRCVVLRFKNRTAVVSPDDPDSFSKALQSPVMPATGTP